MTIYVSCSLVYLIPLSAIFMFTSFATPTTSRATPPNLYTALQYQVCLACQVVPVHNSLLWTLASL